MLMKKSKTDCAIVTHLPRRSQSKAGRSALACRAVGLRRLVTVCALLFSAANVFAQGSLTPSGAPTPTMKSLDQIASTGIAINATNTPGNSASEFVISAPGNYYLTGNLNVTKTQGIDVRAVGVTIDLNSFQIARTSGSAGSGINVASF